MIALKGKWEGRWGTFDYYYMFSSKIDSGGVFSTDNLPRHTTANGLYMVSPDHKKLILKVICEDGAEDLFEIEFMVTGNKLTIHPGGMSEMILTRTAQNSHLDSWIEGL